MNMHMEEFRGTRIFLLLVLLVLCSSYGDVGAQITHPTEVRALQGIRRSLNDSISNYLTNWGKGGDPCMSNWTGVFCYNTTHNDGYLHIIELQFINVKLSGTLSPQLGKLSYMKILNFMRNQLSGSIPKEISDIKSLKLLLLNRNQLTGSLPEELGSLSNLDRIQIDQNYISGPIPKSFANLKKAKHFHMNNNSISGQIPSELSKLPNLIHFLLDNNNLSGYLPSEFSEMPNLNILQLDNNHFDGTIPESYGNMSKLLKLSLRNCSLQGAVPDLSRIPRLAYLDLSWNQLNQSIPSNKLSDGITTIDLSYNNLSGPIPANFSYFPRLQRLSLENNSLSGVLPSNIWQISILNGSESLLLDFRYNMLSNVSTSLNHPEKVIIRLQGNPVCQANQLNIVQLCKSQAGAEDKIFTTKTSQCLVQSCPMYYEYVEKSPVPCFCAAPLKVGYRMKSPAFSRFLPFEDMFKIYVTSALGLDQYQLSIVNIIWEEGPRLWMYLNIFPGFNNLNNTFNESEVRRIRSMFTGWNLPNHEIFGPYELLDFTLSGPYENGTLSSIHPVDFEPSTGLSIGAIAGIAVGSFVAVLLVLAVLWKIGYLCRGAVSAEDKGDIPTGAKRQTNVKVLLESCKLLALQRYKYSDIMVMTKSFKHILGQGGYGRVFQGALRHDGRLVAVKVLNESKGNGEEFINEVVTIGRTNHVNVVSLLGFCIEGTKRALVYEFMPNGSLEKYIYNENTSSSHLGWVKLYEIALGIARGLEYLHCRCNTRILHFDIKPHNILLDHDFLPKISDFGLAKLCPSKESIVSMAGARGTMGYIAPELSCRNLGGVSHKSDVYSYGMMVLEMIGGRKNLDVTVENISGIYFPHWIYNQLKRDVEVEEPEEEIKLEGAQEVLKDETAKKMIIVALWCIQTHPANRPSMTKVVEMLEESNELLQMPPNPSLDPLPLS